MKNKVLNIILLLFGFLLNLFLFIVSTTEIIEEKGTIFFPFLIFETIAIVIFFDSSSKDTYTDKPLLNLSLFLFKATYYFNLFLLIGIFLYFLTNKDTWIIFSSKISSIFILVELFRCLTYGKVSRKFSFPLVLIFTLVKLNENSEFFLGTFGIYYFFESLKDPDTFKLVEDKTQVINSNLKNLKDTFSPFRAKVGLFLFSFTLAIPFTYALKEVLLFIHSFDIIPILRDLLIVKRTYPVLFENLLLLSVTAVVYESIIFVLSKERKIRKTKRVLNIIKNGEE